MKLVADVELGLGHLGVVLEFVLDPIEVGKPRTIDVLVSPGGDGKNVGRHRQGG